ncbi:hypothetical protein ACFL6U_02915 [Planctomycetota bacterium]
MTMATTSTGRARTALTFGQGDKAKGIISTVVAHARAPRNDERVRFVGAVTFDPITVDHIRDILIPLVDSILDSLRLAKKDFELSVVNPGAASVSDLGVEISGFSADVPLFLALLSAALNIPVPGDMVATGHMASSDGDISAVKAIPVKIAAALDDRSIRCFIYPALKKDHSLGALSPTETEQAQVAVINAKGKLTMTAVNDIADLTRVVFTDAAIVAASLQGGFFARNLLKKVDSSPTTDLVRFLTENNETRFWDVLERYFLAGESQEAKSLLGARAQSHIRSETYPREFGRKLLQLLRSLPPATRKLKIDFPLVATLECVTLTQFAGESDTGDIRLLYEAVEGKAIGIVSSENSSVNLDTDPFQDKKDKALVDLVISQIDSTALAKNLAIPIDTARATYMLDSLTIGSSEEFCDTICAFYLHLQRHLHSTSDSVDMDTVRADATALVEQTFANKGGFKAALTEGKDALSGGMKFILDAMTEQFKAERQTKHVNRVIKEAISPLDTNAQVSLISVLLKRLAPHLPQDIATAPPERFIQHYEIIVRAYVQSLDRVHEVFRRF